MNALLDKIKKYGWTPFGDTLYKHPTLPGQRLKLSGNMWSHTIGFGSNIGKTIARGELDNKSLHWHLNAFHDRYED